MAPYFGMKFAHHSNEELFKGHKPWRIYVELTNQDCTEPVTFDCATDFDCVLEVKVYGNASSTRKTRGANKKPAHTAAHIQSHALAAKLSYHSTAKTEWVPRL